MSKFTCGNTTVSVDENNDNDNTNNNNNNNYNNNNNGNTNNNDNDNTTNDNNNEPVTIPDWICKDEDVENIIDDIGKYTPPISPGKINKQKSIPCAIDKQASVPFDEDGDAISTIDSDAMEAILSYLHNTKDLISLSQTSQHMRLSVQHYVFAFVKYSRRIEGLKRFVQSKLATPDELEELKQMGKEKSLQTALYFHHLVHVYGNVRRYRVLDFQGEVRDETESRHDDWLVRKYNNQLQRHVYHLRTICWLHFCPATMADIPAGTYRVSVHIVFGEHFHWPCVRDDAVHRDRPDIATHLMVYDKNREQGEGNLVEVLIEPEYWKDMKRNRFKNSLLHGNAVVRRNGEWGHLLVLRPFTTTKKTTDLQVEWMDHRNAWWKMDLSWDYVQLQEM